MVREPITEPCFRWISVLVAPNCRVSEFGYVKESSSGVPGCVCEWGKVRRRVQRNGASLSATSRRFRAGRSTEEDGFALMVVLGVVLFLSIAGLAVMSLTVTANGASGSLTKASDATRAVDSAFEKAVQKWRVDPGLVNASCAAATSPDTPIQRATDVVKVTCAMASRRPLTYECSTSPLPGSRPSAARAPWSDSPGSRSRTASMARRSRDTASSSATGSSATLVRGH